MIKVEAEKDISPLLRGDVWTALLEVVGNYKDEYVKIDKTTPTPTDRQVRLILLELLLKCTLVFI